MRIYIHVSVINHWQDILTEQLSILASGIVDGFYALEVIINLTNYPNHESYLFAQQLLRASGLPGYVQVTSVSHTECESPTIRLMDADCRNLHPELPILYLHGKGVAHPNSFYRTMWRYYMNNRLLRRLPEAYEKLNNGANWVAAVARNGNEPCPHAAGNYFLTTANFLAHLPRFDHYAKEIYPRLPKLPRFFLPRHADEMWLGSTYVTGEDFADEGDRPWDPSWWKANPLAYRQHLTEQLLNHLPK